MTMKAILIIVVTLWLVGCATPTTGILPVTDNLYSITHHASIGLVPSSDLKVSAIADATKFCETKGRTFKLVSSEEKEGGAFGRWPEAKILFSC